jgi:hypothetical protein
MHWRWQTGQSQRRPWPAHWRPAQGSSAWSEPAIGGPGEGRSDALALRAHVRYTWACGGLLSESSSTAIRFKRGLTRWANAASPGCASWGNLVRTGFLSPRSSCYGESQPVCALHGEMVVSSAAISSLRAGCLPAGCWCVMEGNGRAWFDGERQVDRSAFTALTYFRHPTVTLLHVSCERVFRASA